MYDPNLPMNAPIDMHMDQIKTFCEKWRILEFSLFGSVLRRDQFGPGSDIDVLVTFAGAVQYGMFDLVRMEQELQELLGRHVDLVERKAIEQSENYIRRRAILNSAEVVYAA